MLRDLTVKFETCARFENNW